MPQLGLEVTEGTVLEIVVEVGSVVAKDDPLVVLSTDKADVDVVAPASGVVESIAVAAGDTINVGATLLWLTTSAEAPEQAAEPEQAAGHVSSAVPEPTRPSEPPQAPRTRTRASPVARRAAESVGLDLTTIAGTGPNGRVNLSDIRDAIAERAIPMAVEVASGPAHASEPDPVTELSPMRRATARRMSTSQREIPQYHLTRELDASHLQAQRAAAAAASGDGPAPNVNDLLTQAIGEMLRRHPTLASKFVEGDADAPAALRANDQIDVGLAVATDAGLTVPVIRDVPARSLREIAADRARLVAGARAHTLRLPELSGAVITLSNLGGFGVDQFAAMVNPGESAIVAVGRITDRVVPRGRAITVLPILTVTVTFDHRVIDGATGARALSELAELLEGRMLWRL